MLICASLSLSFFLLFSSYLLDLQHRQPPRKTHPTRAEFSVILPCSGNVSGIAMFSIGLLIQTRKGKPVPGTPLRIKLRKECAHRGVYERSSTLTSSSQGSVCLFLVFAFVFVFVIYYVCFPAIPTRSLSYPSSPPHPIFPPYSTGSMSLPCLSLFINCGLLTTALFTSQCDDRLRFYADHEILPRVTWLICVLPSHSQIVGTYQLESVKSLKSNIPMSGKRVAHPELGWNHLNHSRVSSEFLDNCPDLFLSVLCTAQHPSGS